MVSIIRFKLGLVGHVFEHRVFGFVVDKLLNDVFHCFRDPKINHWMTELSMKLGYDIFMYEEKHGNIRARLSGVGFSGFTI